MLGWKQKQCLNSVSSGFIKESGEKTKWMMGMEVGGSQNVFGSNNSLFSISDVK